MSFPFNMSKDFIISHLRANNQIINHIIMINHSDTHPSRFPETQSRFHDLACCSVGYRTGPFAHSNRKRTYYNRAYELHYRYDYRFGPALKKRSPRREGNVSIYGITSLASSINGNRNGDEAHMLDCSISVRGSNELLLDFLSQPVHVLQILCKKKHICKLRQFDSTTEAESSFFELSDTKTIMKTYFTTCITPGRLKSFRANREPNFFTVFE